MSKTFLYILRLREPTWGSIIGQGLPDLCLLISVNHLTYQQTSAAESMGSMKEECW
jgi:hypothetical protein